MVDISNHKLENKEKVLDAAESISIWGQPDSTKAVQLLHSIDHENVIVARANGSIEVTNPYTGVIARKFEESMGGSFVGLDYSDR